MNVCKEIIYNKKELYKYKGYRYRKQFKQIISKIISPMERLQSVNNVLNSLMLKKVFKDGQQSWKDLEKNKMIMKQ